MTDQELYDAATLAVRNNAIEECEALADELEETKALNKIINKKYEELVAKQGHLRLCADLYTEGLLNGGVIRARNKKRSTIGVLYGLLATGLAVWGLWHG